MKSLRKFSFNLCTACFYMGVMFVLVTCNPLTNQLKKANEQGGEKDAIDSDNLGPLDTNGDENENILKIENLENLKKNEQLSLDRLKPVDHIDAVKMEQDGHMNREYHKELFLGDHEEFELDSEHAEAKLMDIFKKVDSDQDQHLSEAEMEGWIIQKMDEHFDEARRENEEIFKHLDPDGNGLVHWKEYYTHFLLAKGYPEATAKKHVQDYDEIELDTDAKEELVRYKFRWTDADFDPADNQLNKTEFLGFRHPEQSNKTISSMVFSIMNSMDTDEDGVLSLKEFIALPPGEVEGEEEKEMDAHWQKEREDEFLNAIDTDGSKDVSAQELMKYLDPTNKVQALMEARNLISLMDEDKDKLVSMEEVMRHKDIFLSSKVVDFAANVHDEF